MIVSTITAVLDDLEVCFHHSIFTFFQEDGP
jgi:hypothetical protein